MPTSEQRLFVTVKSPEETLFEGDAFAISSRNENGLFDVLPEHANFICMISGKITIHLSKGFKKEFPIEQGVLKAFNNEVNVFLGIESLKK